MKKISGIKKQGYFFGAIVDPIVFIAVSLTILLLNISIVNEIGKRDALLHTTIGLLLGVVARTVFAV